MADRFRNPLAVDTETSGLRPWQGDVVKMASFCDARGAWAEPPEQARETLAKAVDEGRLIIMHNSPFDRAVFSANWGIEIPDDQIWDTMAVDWMLDENADHRLKEGLGARLFGTDAKAEKEALMQMMRGRKVEEVYRELREIENRKPRAERERAAETRIRAREIAQASRKTWEDLTFEDLLPYAEQDAALTYGAFWWQQDALHEDGFVHVDLERQLRVGGLCYRITKRGIRVDQARAEQDLTEAEERIAEIQSRFDGVNLRSSQQLQKLLYEDWGLPVPKRTKSGAPSTDKDALEALSYDPRVVDLIEFRRLVKQTDAYYFPLLDRISKDGRVHPSFNAWRTVTGRLSCSGPNLQTIPRESTAAEIRKVFIPADGLVLTEFDLSQIEVRIAADLANEPNLLIVYEEGGDVYQALADEIGVDRQTAKQVILSAQYGIGPRKLSVNLARGTGRQPNLTQARQILRRYWSHYRNLNRLMKGLEESARRRGYVSLPQPGRRRLFKSPHLPYPRYYSALNAMIQGSAADLLQNILLELDPAISDVGQVVLTVHDSVVVEHEPGAEERVHKLLDEITRDVSPFGIPTPWERKPWR